MDFAFVNSNATRIDRGSRKLIRSHVMRGRNQGRVIKGRGHRGKEDAEAAKAAFADLSARAAAPVQRNLSPEEETSPTPSRRDLAAAFWDSVEVHSRAQGWPTMPLPRNTFANMELDYFMPDRELKPAMKRRIYEFHTSIMDALYPTELCDSMPALQAPWFRYMVADRAFFHLLIAMTATYTSLFRGDALVGGPEPLEATQHLVIGLRLVNLDLAAAAQGRQAALAAAHRAASPGNMPPPPSAVSLSPAPAPLRESTVACVVSLAMYANLTEEYRTSSSPTSCSSSSTSAPSHHSSLQPRAPNINGGPAVGRVHLEGLQRILAMRRGGLAGLIDDDDAQIDTDRPVEEGPAPSMAHPSYFPASSFSSSASSSSSFSSNLIPRQQQQQQRQPSWGSFGGSGCVAGRSLQQKICRADVDFAIMHGGAATRFGRGSWWGGRSPFGTIEWPWADGVSGGGEGPVHQHQHQQHPTLLPARQLVQGLAPPLLGVLLDVVAFCRRANAVAAAAAAGRSHSAPRLSPFLYQDFLISVFQRLLDFCPLEGGTAGSFDDDKDVPVEQGPRGRDIAPLDNIWQLGLLCFLSPMAYKIAPVRRIYGVLLFGELGRLLQDDALASKLPGDVAHGEAYDSMRLWLLMSYGVAVDTAHTPQNAENIWIGHAIWACATALRLRTWDDAKRALLCFPWLEPVFDAPARKLWDCIMEARGDEDYIGMEDYVNYE